MKENQQLTCAEMKSKVIITGRESEGGGWSIVASHDEEDLCHKAPDSIMTSTLLKALLLALVSPPPRPAGVFTDRSNKPRRSRFDELVVVREAPLAAHWPHSEFIVLQP
jgi:hypothetical protein